MTSAPARRSAALAAALLAASALSACGSLDGATSLDEALAVADAQAQAAGPIDAKATTSSAAGISFSPSTVVAGQPVTVTVGLSGTPIYVGFPSTALAGPRVVSTRTFTLVTNPYLAAPTTVTISARTASPNPSVTVLGTLTIVPGPLAGGTLPRVASVQLAATSVTNGTAIPGSLTLSAPAPAGGLTVQVALSNDQLMLSNDVPPVVTVPAGATSAAFTVRTHLQTAAITPLTDYVVANAFGGPFAGVAFTVTR
jgi:hypothetical protein